MMSSHKEGKQAEIGTLKIVERCSSQGSVNRGFQAMARDSLPNRTT